MRIAKHQSRYSFLLIAGKYVMLEPFTKSATTYYISDEKKHRQLHREENCLSDFENSESTDVEIMGAKATHVWESYKGFELDSQISAELGCLILKETATHPSGARNETEITQLSLVEPPDSFFEVPAGYLERSPSELQRVYAAKFGGRQLFGPAILERQEQNYYQSRR